jgi:hypothetical protein
MTWMQQSRRKTMPPRLIEQIRFDGGFLDAILSERMLGLIFNSWHNRAGAMRPDRAAVEKMLDMATQRLDKLLGACQGKADHIHYNIGLKLQNSLTEKPCRILRLFIDNDLLNRFPGRVGLIRLALSPADIHNNMSGLNQSWDEVCPDMAAAPDHYDTHSWLPFKIVRKKI